MRLDDSAERFNAAGYRCLVFHYRNFAASDGGPRQIPSVRRRLENWRNAI